MISHYLKVAIRQLRRNKTNTVVNSIGLGFALASVALIAAYVSYERSYDDFHPDVDAIYQLSYQEISTPAMRHVASVSPPTAPTMVEELPEVAAGLRLRIGTRHLLSSGVRRFFEEGIVYADSTFFEMLGFELLVGNPLTALSDPSSIVLTESMALKYFDDEDPIGREVTIDDERSFFVTGVVENVPANTHLRFDFLLAFDAFRVPSGYPTSLTDWRWISFPTFVKLASGADPIALETKLQDFMARHYPARSAEVARLRIKPIRDVYLSGPVDPSFVQGNDAYL